MNKSYITHSSQLRIRELMMSTGTIVDSYFRKYKKYKATLDKYDDNPSLQIIFSSKLSYYQIIIWPQNIEEVIETEELEYFIKIQGRPSVERIEEKRKYRSTYACLISSKENNMFKMIFPHFFVLKLEFLDGSGSWRAYLSSLKIHCISGWLSTISYKQYPINLEEMLDLSSISWETKYYVLVLLTNSLMPLHYLNPDIIEIFKDPKACLALREMYYAFKAFTIDDYRAFCEKPLPDREVPCHHISIKKVIVTPTTCIFLPPDPEIGNRVMRKYHEFSEYFLRLSFCEENLEKRVWPRNSEVLEKYKNVLDGLTIFDYDYEFLGFSNSQMRGHSCWMVIKTLDSWAQTIRNDLGDFSICKTTAKYASRLGLCFSSTYKTLPISKAQILHIPDIDRNGYNFSDGIGKISPEFLLETRSLLDINPNEEISAIQIRLGGCKGVVALAPELENSIAIRPSMIKFSSGDSDLEVCSFAKYKPAYLNRQIILLLCGLGVPQHVFLDMQKEVITLAQNSTKDEVLAIHFLSHYNSVSMNDVIAMLQMGFIIKQEPYIEGMLQCVYSNFVSEIKEKAHFLAPQSALLVGVLDEYSVLEHEQVYIRISTSNNSRVITGKVVLAKNPCLHPGDVKVVMAVDVPELAHLANVLVFPQKGPRPIPNQCSGSDLDGDEYFVSWNPLLIPSKTVEAMDYDPETEKVETKITINSVKDYFIRYMESENLGCIGNLHMIYSDLLGIHSNEALELAMLHSKAVDYAKTGIPVTVPYELQQKSWPDFMQKPWKKPYESPGILGKLFRSVNIEKLYTTSYSVIKYQLLKEGFEKYLGMAEDLYKDFKREVQGAIRKFQLSNEFEFFIGKSSSFKWNSNNNKSRILKKASQIKTTIRKRFFTVNGETERTKLASAFYYVAYTEKKPVYTFPWIVYSYILK